ncbi:hypothetical protein ACPSM1_19330 [Micromonospora chersina]|uniref:hypothetical protein n=1 Tax=Micromonospora chersina TaxID=47854 RepID=UPI003CBAB630
MTFPPAVFVPPMNGRLQLGAPVDRVSARRWTRLLTRLWDPCCMKLDRWILVITLVVVAGLGFWFSVARWDDTSKIASVLSALAGVAAVGVAVWAALRGTATSAEVTVKDSGNASSDSGDTNTGMRGKAAPAGLSVKIKNSGDADSRNGSSNTGVHLGP